MSIGPFQRLPGSAENWGSGTLPSEPWLLPISDVAEVGSTKTTQEGLQRAVRRASRPFWIAANVLCAALGLMLTVEMTSGWLAVPAHRGTTGPVAAMSSPPTIPAQQASVHVDVP